MWKFQYRDGSNLTQKELQRRSGWQNRAGQTSRQNRAGQTSRQNRAGQTSRQNRAGQTSRLSQRKLQRCSPIHNVVGRTVTEKQRTREAAANLRHIVKVADLRHIVKVADLRHTIKVTDLRHTIKATDLRHTIKVTDLRHTIKVETSLSAPRFQLHCNKFPFPCNISQPITLSGTSA